MVKLEQNYRSTSAILNCANEVIQNNIGRKDKRLWTNKGEGRKVRFCMFEDGYEEAGSVVGDIMQRVSRGEISYNQCAILYRTNAQSRSFEEKCIAYSVPYKIVGGINFYQRQEIKDMLAYLKTIDNGRDDLSVKRIINVPRRGIGQTTVDKVSKYAEEQGISFFQALTKCRDISGISGAAANKLNSFVQQIYVLRTQSEYMDLPEFLNTLLESTGYEQELENLEAEKAEQKHENIQEMISKAQDFQDASENPSLTSFLEEIALVADVDSLEEDADYVTLMTLHGAKGLEFPYVFLVGMEDGLFPSYRSLFSEDPTDVEEERRLCYVGITRAMEELVLTAAKMRTIRGEMQYNKMSRFVEEIPPHLLERKSAGTQSGSHISATSKFVGNYNVTKGNTYENNYNGKSYNGKSYNGNSYNENSYSSDSYNGKSYGSTQGFGSGNGFGSGAANGKAVARSVDALRNLPNTNKGVSGLIQVTDTTVKHTKTVPTKSTATGVSYTQTSITQNPVKTSDLGYTIGDTVRHIKFGIGTVLNIEDSKRDYEVTVDFERFGQKRMFATFAKLKKV